MRRSKEAAERGLRERGDLRERELKRAERAKRELRRS